MADTNALLSLLSELYAPPPYSGPGFRAYHGSAKNFREFDDRYVGSGDDVGKNQEGGDEGWGHYLTADPITANRYARELYAKGLSLPMSRLPHGFIHDTMIRADPSGNVLNQLAKWKDLPDRAKAALYHGITAGSFVEDDSMNPDLNPAMLSTPRVGGNGDLPDGTSNVIDIERRYIDPLIGRKSWAKRLEAFGFPVRKFSNLDDQGDNYIVANPELIDKRAVAKSPRYKGIGFSKNMLKQMQDDVREFYDRDGYPIPMSDPRHPQYSGVDPSHPQNF